VGVFNDPGRSLTVDTPTALIDDANVARADQLRSLLSEANFLCTDVASVEAGDKSADVLFLAGDMPGSAGSDELVTSFAQRVPGAPIIVVTEAPLWELIALAVRHRAWMDVPRTERYDDLLARYATSKSPCPKIIMEENAARCNQLLDQWRESSHCDSDLVLVHSVGEALETAVGGQVSVLLNHSITPGTLEGSGISTLIYTLCPAVIAVIIEACDRRRADENYVLAEPGSRFALLKPPFRSKDVRTLLNRMNVNWPVTSPL
jgi:hypothetical protein